ncbi:type II toxin-antitoxin system prevent-host-death family antitoxin [Patescibacteria group bacterium]|nr:type II toxin-antitoxin system prevent-host-death family antitoxin [Patescibacteria group bacterium]
MPQTVSTKDIQRHYRDVFDQAQHGPVVVMTNNKPDVVIMSLARAEDLFQKAKQTELDKILKAITLYNRDKKAGKLIHASSLQEFI